MFVKVEVSFWRGGHCETKNHATNIEWIKTLLFSITLKPFCSWDATLVHFDVVTVQDEIPNCTLPLYNFMAILWSWILCQSLYARSEGYNWRSKQFFKVAMAHKTWVKIPLKFAKRNLYLLFQKLTQKNLQYHFGNGIRLRTKLCIGLMIYELVNELQELLSDVFVKWRFISSLSKSKRKSIQPIHTFVHKSMPFPKWYCRFLWVKGGFG